MPRSPIEIVKAILDNPTNLKFVSQLVAPDATYVSLNDNNPELKKIMPWTGTQHGPEAIVSTYARVGRYWKNEAFETRPCRLRGLGTSDERRLRAATPTPWAHQPRGPSTLLAVSRSPRAPGWPRGRAAPSAMDRG